jgi:hypothetical protein
MSKYFDESIKELGLNEKQKKLLDKIGGLMGYGSPEHLATESQVISEMSLANTIDASAKVHGQAVLDATRNLSLTIEKQTDVVVKSNEKLAISNEKYSRAMVKLTWALVFVGVAGIVVQIIQFF